MKFILKYIFIPPFSLFDIVSQVTADGSIDCQGDPARQEFIVGELHLAEAALERRENGGWQKHTRTCFFSTLFPFMEGFWQAEK